MTEVTAQEVTPARESKEQPAVKKAATTWKAKGRGKSAKTRPPNGRASKSKSAKPAATIESTQAKPELKKPEFQPEFCMTTQDAVNSYFQVCKDQAEHQQEMYVEKYTRRTRQ